jgi:uncharacterized repeat protein (TIGR03803 family)
LREPDVLVLSRGLSYSAQIAKGNLRLLLSVLPLLFLSSNSSASTARVLHTFTGGNDGATPHASLTLDDNGNLYGTTEDGGQFAHGVVFMLTPSAKWEKTVLHTFDGENQGWYPDAGVVFDGSGTLFGTTNEGGPEYEGTVFELIRQPNSRWKERVLHSFSIYGEDILEAPAVFDKVVS